MQTFIANPANLQAEFFRGLNRLVEPFIRVGFASAVCSPTGLIVLETRGRETGRRIKVPLLATRLGRLVMVSTFRPQSQWVNNLEAEPQVRYWLGGQVEQATGPRFPAPTTPAQTEKPPPLI